ncbi:MAG TPA: serine protease [Polyangiaceae bacterium]|nr:serine protease [Polyangiaceae bacterium]
MSSLVSRATLLAVTPGEMRLNWLWSTIVVTLVGCGGSAAPSWSSTPSPSYPGPPAGQSRSQVDAPLARSASELRSSPTPAPSALLSPAQIAAQASQSVVVIITPEGRGAGFVVGPNLVATCYHVIEAADRMAIRTRDGVEHAAHSVVQYSKADDIAVLAVDDLDAPRLRFGDFTAVAPGDPVTVIGHPRGLDSSVSTGIVSALRNTDTEHPLLQITAPISPGSSGGPVLNQKGEVIGVTSFLLRNGQELNFAVPVPALTKLLALESEPIPLSRFAQISAVKKDPRVTDVAEVAPEPLPAAPAARVLPPFPKRVAGFGFGMTLEQAKLTCASPATQAAMRDGLHSVTDLALDGVYGACPFAPEPLDFVRDVRLKFAAGQLVQIVLIATSYESARQRLLAKYGNPAGCLMGDLRASWTPDVERRASGCGWDLDGGVLALARETDRTPAFVVYLSSTADELQRVGY